MDLSSRAAAAGPAPPNRGVGLAQTRMAQLNTQDANRVSNWRRSPNRSLGLDDSLAVDIRQLESNLNSQAPATDMASAVQLHTPPHNNPRDKPCPGAPRYPPRD